MLGACGTYLGPATPSRTDSAPNQALTGPENAAKIPQPRQGLSKRGRDCPETLVFRRETQDLYANFCPNSRRARAHPPTDGPTPAATSEQPSPVPAPKQVSTHLPARVSLLANWGALLRPDKR